MNFDAEEYYVKIRLRYNNVSLINLLEKNNRHYTFVTKIDVIKIVININKHYSNVENFEDFKKDRHK